MRSTLIEEGYLGSHPCLLKVGDEQPMMFRDTDVGPFFNDK
jgi:hypothetical protein